MTQPLFGQGVGIWGEGFPQQYANLSNVYPHWLVKASHENAQSIEINNIEYVLTLNPPKASVRVATAGPLGSYAVVDNVMTAASEGSLVVDGVSVATGDRVVVIGELGANAIYNGVYVVTDPGSVGTPWILTRAPDMTLSTQVPGACTYVSEGAVNAGIIFAVSGATSSFVLNTTAMTWVDLTATLNWQSARLATVAPLPPYTASGNTLTATENGLLSVDGTDVVLGDRVAVQSETSQQFNGIFLVLNPGSESEPWVATRVADMSTSSQVEGTMVYIREGETLSGTLWGVTSTGAFVINEDDITWAQLAGPPQSAVNMNGQRVTNVADPVDAQDAATRSWVLSQPFGVNPMSAAGDMIAGGTSPAGTPTRVPGNASTTTLFLTQAGDGTTPGAPAWNAISSTNLPTITEVGTVTAGTWEATPIALAYGGTNADLTASNGGIVYCNATSMAILAGTSTADRVLLSGASGAPSWSTATYPASTSANQLLYSSASNAIGGLATANSSVLVTNASGVPSLSTALPNGVTATTQSSGDNTTKLATTAFVQAAISGFVTNPMTTLGDMIYGGSSGVETRLPGSTSSTKHFLTQTGSGSASAEPVWGTIAATDLPTFAGSTYLSDYATDFVNSITGTASQVIASASAGAVTLSLPQNIATSSSLQFGSIQLGTHASQYNALACARSSSGGADYEFGHSNTAGYGSVLGHEYDSGYPFLAFCCGPDPSNPNKYETLGNIGTVIRADTSGNLTFNTVSNDDAGDQSLTALLTIAGAGSITTNTALVLQSTIQWYGNTSGSKSASLGSNCPAVSATGPYTWLEAISHDGSAVYIPCWK